MRTISPSEHYSLRVSDDVNEDYDERVLSLWRDGDNTALQLSSYLRTDGEQTNANRRLQDRISGTSGQWKKLEMDLGAGCDLAAASVLKDGVEWWHCYFVTEQLAVYATLSFPEEQKPSVWALEALRSIRFGDSDTVPV